MKKLFIVFIIAASSVTATNLRGYVQKCNQDHECNASTFTEVKLYSWDGNRWSPQYSTYSGKDGFFYLFNVNPGDYYILVNKTIWFKVRVNNTKWQDVPTLSYNY